MKNSKEQSKPSFVPDKTKFKDAMGKYITQSLFLEIGYTEHAVYTLNDEDKCYKGRIYPSLRKLYIEMADPTEYLFATTYLWGWDHWLKISNNGQIAKEVEKWRDELEVKLRANGVASMINQSGSNFNAAKWVADGQWKQKRGRPSKAELEGEKKKRQRVLDEVENDAARILHLIPGAKNGTNQSS